MQENLLKKIFVESTKTDYFTSKKIKCTFVLAILVMMYHNSSVANYEITSSLGKIASYISEFFLAFAQVAVPLFFIISGALFFRNYDYGKTLTKYKDRLKSLVIPYLLWNTINTAFAFVCSYTFISKYFIGRQKTVVSFENILGGCSLISTQIFGLF